MAFQFKRHILSPRYCWFFSRLYLYLYFILCYSADLMNESCLRMEGKLLYMSKSSYHATVAVMSTQRLISQSSMEFQFRDLQRRYDQLNQEKERAISNLR